MFGSICKQGEGYRSLFVGKGCFLPVEKLTLQRRRENRLCRERIFCFDLYNTDKNGKISNRLARELPLEIRKKYIPGGR